jgi:hypothetical protein
LFALLTLGLTTAAGQAQNRFSEEQSHFAAEQEVIRVQHPVTLPEEALRVLRTDDNVRLCVRHEHLSPDQVPPSWFVASEIHLNGQTEADLIVQPAIMTDSPAPNRCLYGAKTVQFWVLRKTAQEYQLVLTINSVDLNVLKTKRNGYRDIVVSELTVSEVTRAIYRFDGKKYKLSQTKTEPIG